MAVEGPGSAQTPFETIVSRIGQEGLNIKKSLDMLAQTELARGQNFVSTTAGFLQTRPGQIDQGQSPDPGSGLVHSIARLNDPQASAFARFVGVGTTAYRVGDPTSDTGYSGDPLTMLSYRPPLSGASYLFVADRSRMSKVARTGPRLQIGLPKPSGLTSATIAPGSLPLALFDGSDGTNAALWTGYGGFDLSGTAQSSAPSIVDTPGLLVGGSGILVTSNPGAATTGYPTLAAIAHPLNVTAWNDGSGNFWTDNDLMHVDLKINNPVQIEEVRIYFTVDPFATVTAQLAAPTALSLGIANVNAYVATIHPSDYSDFAAATGVLVDNQATFAGNNANGPKVFTQDGRVDDNTKDPNPSVTNVPTLTTAPLASQQWVEFGRVGLPLRRSDFVPQGRAGTTGLDWASVTGVVLLILTSTKDQVSVGFDDCYITGGFGPDTTEPGSQKYDYRATNFDPRTGAESNPSDVQVLTAFLDAARQAISVTPNAFGDVNIRQRIYRRGGSLTADWYFLGTNTGDGASFKDVFTDATALAGGTVEIDHDQPVTTVDASGNAVLNQPIPVIWGPIQSLILGCGDPFRPGDVYWCKPGEPDHWPAANHTEVCSPSEELMAGGVYGGQAFVFSRERLYGLLTNLTTTGTVVGIPTDCAPGMMNRWGLAVGPGGIYYVARDGIRVTQGGEGHLISDPIRPLFNGETRNGFLPIDMTALTSIRLESHNNDIWFIYKDTGATLRCLVYSIIYKNWRNYTFAFPPTVVYSDPTQDGTQSLFMGAANGHIYTHAGTDDSGVAISCSARTGANDYGYPRGDTLFGDIVVDADMQGQTLSAQAFLNNEQASDTAQSVGGLVGRRRYTFEPFGTSGDGPQKARNLSIELTWAGSAAGSPIIEFVGAAVQPQPNVTMNRVTAWDTPAVGESYLYGMWMDVDTGNSPRTVHVETDLNGSVTSIATLTVNPLGLTGRHKWWFSWPVVKANMIRLRPDDSCVPWELYKYDWLQQQEPPRIAGWDTNYENLQDAYLTGVYIECDTFGVNKTVNVILDQTILTTLTVNANGRLSQPFSFNIVTPIRGRVVKLVATDANPGLLYSWRWIKDAEPVLMANWAQDYTVESTLADKWLKGVILQADTLNQTKVVGVEVDGTIVTTLNVTHAGRTVNQYSFPQVLGRVFRLVPTDANPGRLYAREFIFDEEPLSLGRWETQELDFDDMGWKAVLGGFITIKTPDAVNPVTLTTTVLGQSGTAMATLVNVLPGTSGAKQKIYVPFAANKGVLYKFVFTCATAFWLYREESTLIVQPWGGKAKGIKPFGNDDLDLVRGMHHAGMVASQQGGGQG